MQTGAALPIDAVLEELRAALRASSNAVLLAPPGAGKTTRVPLALLQDGWAAKGKLLLLSPRRIAARAAAARMASMLGQPIGQTIGYRLRLDSRVSAQTRLEIITQGVFTRMILDDPALEGVAGILFDEFHERSMEADLGLALAMDAQAGLRPDLRLLVMSATLDGARLARLLGDCPIIESVGRAHFVGLRYLGRDPRAPIEEEMAKAALRALRDETGSILCFLPGTREINRCARRLEGEVGADVDIRPLFGALEPAAQDEAIAPPLPGRRKLVIASAIAESSLTIEGVRVVIDGGLARRAVFDPISGLSSLETVRASQASITQRAGRAGRLGPGVCWRLWEEAEARALPAFDPPEILGADLSPLVLSLADWGVAEAGALRWLDAPPQTGWELARKELESLGGLDGAGRINAHGRILARLPVAPRLAHMAVCAVADGHGALAGEIAVLLGEQGLAGNEVDLRGRVEALRGLHGKMGQAARDLAKRLALLAGESAVKGAPANVELIGMVLARAFPGRVAMARADRPGEYVLANGRGAGLPPNHALAGERFLVVAELAGQAQKGRILSAAPLLEADLLRLFPEAARHQDSMAFDEESGRVRGRRARSLGAITLSQSPIEAARGEALAEAWREGVRAHGLSCLPDGARLSQLRARMALLQRVEPSSAWPDWSDAALLQTLEGWLGPELAQALQSGQKVEEAFEAALRDMLDWGQQRVLDQLAPARFESPAGGIAAIDYVGPGGPSVEIRIQEVFGLAVHPCIANGRVRLVLRLLSPAQRPVQITEDLLGFWKGSYAQVRADLRGRYPRHPWPENPLEAPPTRRAKPRTAPPG